MNSVRLVCLLMLGLVFSAGSLTAQVYINEHNADPTGTPGTDANGDGLIDSTQDEFVEIVNAGASAVNIGGWTISDAVQVRHTFAMGTTLNPGAAIVVFGGGSLTTFNALGVGSGVGASTGSVGLNNGGDTITLADSMAMVIDQVIYTSSGNGESTTRDPDAPASPFVLHTTLTPGIGHSAGYMNDATTGWLSASFAPPPAASQVYINEYCNDPYDATSPLDTNQDGVFATSSSQGNDEFVEIVNAGPTSVDIGDWTLQYNGSLRHTFATGTQLPAGGCIVIFGGGDVTNFNTLGAATGVLATNGFLGLGNSGGTISLLDDMAMSQDSITYTSGSPQDGDGQSVTRVSDMNTDAFNLHSTVSAFEHSAGYNIDFMTPWLPAIIPSVQWPGNLTDFEVSTSINNALQTSPTKVFTANALDGVNLYFHSPGQTTELFPMSCFFQLLPTGTPLTSAVIPGEAPPGGFWLDQSGSFAIFTLFDGIGLASGGTPQPFTPVVPIGGMNYTFGMPLGLNGLSLLIQSLVLEPGLNGLNLGIDDAIEIQIP